MADDTPRNRGRDLDDDHPGARPGDLVGAPGEEEDVDDELDDVTDLDDDLAADEDDTASQRLLRGSVDDVMSTALLTVTDDESLLLAWELMERTGYHHLPVVDDDGRCVGVVERGELAVACALPATALAERDVSDVLTPMATSVPAGTGIVAAARRMAEHQLDAIAVTGDGDVLLGLLTARDLVSVVAGRRRVRHAAADRGPVLFRMEPVLPG